MELTVRKSSDGDWGFVESYKRYDYLNTITVNVVVGVGKDGKMKEPFAMRSGCLVPLRVVDEEMTLERYLKAKKPIYCKVKDGFIVAMKAAIDYRTREYAPERSSATVYTVNRGSVLRGDCGELKLVSILDVPEEIQQLIDSFMKGIAEADDRAKFLRSRFANDVDVAKEPEADDSDEFEDDVEEE